MVNRGDMPLLGEVFPNFTAESTAGPTPIDFYEWSGNSWVVLFSHPVDFTPVCTTELGSIAELLPEFKKRGVKVIGLSCDSLADHKIWAKDIKHLYSLKEDEDTFPYPIIADKKRELALQFGMVDAAMKDAPGMQLTVRAVFVIGPDKKLKLSIMYPASTGRNYVELLRAIDSLQTTARAEERVATPVNWQVGDEVLVATSVEEDRYHLFPHGIRQVDVPSGKNYMRYTRLDVPD